MLSRVADSLYWLTRNVERAENVARFVDVNLHMTLDLPSDTEQQWEPLINTTGDREQFLEHFGPGFNRDNVIQFLTFDPDYSNSILSCVHSARENARSIREVISSEMWMQINRFYLMVRGVAFSDDDLLTTSPHEFFTAVKTAGHTFEGIMDATMSHNEAWHFGQLGRLLERADKTTRILDMKYFILLPDVTYVGSPFDNIQWAALLRSASALEMYRKKHGRIVPKSVVDFLLLDPEFPRSVKHCIRTAEDSLRTIGDSPPGTYRNRAEQELGRLRAKLDFTSTSEVMSTGLHEFLNDLQQQLNDIGDAIHEAMFTLVPTPQDAGTQLQTQTS
ncbi:MAG: alpha-E domain-containing protein [Actinomycetota bacterium]